MINELSSSAIDYETLNRKSRQPLAPMPLMAGHVVTHATPKLLIAFLLSKTLCGMQQTKTAPRTF